MRETIGAIALSLVAVSCATGADPTDGIEDTQPAEGVPYWSAGSSTNEGKSTHLWIVDHAITILSKHQSIPNAAKAYARLTNAACKPNWQQGLQDADDKPTYNNWWTWKSHFYDPSTGTNWAGGTDVAYNRALQYLGSAKTKLAANDVKGGCYDLGLALHYATDITQPMHAANYPATDNPLNLHSHLEDRATVIQNNYVLADWTGSAPTGTVNTVLNDIAWASNALWPGTWNALGNAYQAKCGRSINSEWIDTTSCWSGDAGVDAQVGVALRGAQSSTAKFLVAAAIP